MLGDRALGLECKISISGILAEGRLKYWAKGGGVGGMLEHELRRLFDCAANCPTGSSVSPAAVFLGVAGDLFASLEPIIDVSRDRTHVQRKLLI